MIKLLSLLSTLFVLWLIPIVWVVSFHAWQRRRYSMKTPLRLVVRDAKEMARWPLGIIDLVRGKR